MAKISTYALSSPVSLGDKLIGTDVYDVTKNFTLGSIVALTGITGTANTIPMFSATGFKDSPIYTVPGSEGITVGNKITVPKINFGYNAYYGRDMFISGIDEGPFDGIQVTNEFVIGKEVNTTGDIAMYFKYGDERVGGIFLDDDASQQGLALYVQESATNANIVKKISLRDPATIGSALASTLPPANGLAVQGEAKFYANVIVDDKIGIRIEDPQRELDVDGGVRIRGTLDLFQGNENTFAGTDAGNLFNVVSSANAGFGKGSQAAQLNGNSNSSLGHDSLKSSTNGNNNTAIGANSLFNSEGGSFNTALGSGSLQNATLGQGNTAIGTGALFSKTTTNFNTAVGNESLANMTSGFRNTAVGNEAGKFTNTPGATANATGNFSVFIGDSTKAEASGQNNQIVIGYNAIGNGANTATIGNTATTALHVGGNNAGIVLKSPNGTAYTIRVTDAGALVVS